MTGLCMAVVLLCSGVATYSPALVSVHLAQFLGILLIVPALLAYGSPLALWLSEPAREVPSLVRPLVDPLAGATLVCALVLLTFRTPLVELSLRHPWVHLLLLGVAAVAGTIFLTPLLCRPDAAPGDRQWEHGLGVVGVAACLGLLAYQLRYGDDLLAGWWFLELGWRWADPAADQRLGGAVVAAAALLILLVWPVAALASRATR
jgi:putative copper resistance protein D